MNNAMCRMFGILGSIDHESSVRQVIYDILDEFADTMATLGEKAGLD